MARAEALLLRRNAIAMITALALPAVTVLGLRQPGYVSGGADGLGSGAMIATSLAAFAVLFVTYYNIVTALVARREDLVLKRLRCGEITDPEIIIGTALPSVAIAWAQAAVGFVAAIAVLGMGRPVNVLLVIVAIPLGTVVFVLLAAVSTAVTRTVEMAQVTTMPVLIVSLVSSGLIFPLNVLPEPWERLANMTPLASLVDVLRLGLTGTTSAGSISGLTASLEAALPPLLVLTCWIGAGVWATRRWFRWEPRR